MRQPRIVVRRRGDASRTLAEHVVEVVAPRTNTALITPAENLFGALSLQTRVPGGGPVSLEIVGDAERSRFLIRTATAEQQRTVRGQVSAAYPQAALRVLDLATLPAGDPLAVGPDEQTMSCTLRLRAGDHLPLRTFRDRDVDSDAGLAQTDPLLGILGALSELPPGWRAFSQAVVFDPAGANWARRYQRLALENPATAERSGRGDARASLSSVIVIVCLGLSAVVGLNAWSAWLDGDWWTLAFCTGAIGAAVGAALALYVVFGRRELHDPKLVQDKLSGDACRAELRLGVIAPSHAALSQVRARLDRLAAAFRAFSLAAGNSLVAVPVRAPMADLRELAPLGRVSLLNARELACLWHLPQAADDVLLVERTTARRRLPLPTTVAMDGRGEGCRIGRSEHHGHDIRVVLPDGLLRRHLLAIAKTRRGKSSLMLRLVHHLMLAGTSGPGGRAAGPRKRCVILVDPHSDLATAALSLVPVERHPDVVYLDVSNRRRPFGINLLDVGLGWDRDQAVGSALRVFRREFDAFWGPRMEDAFRFALMALFEANEAICRMDPIAGRGSQHTVLEVPDLLGIPRFRSRVLKLTSDPAIRHWFSSYFEPLELRHRQEIINPVQTKVHKYAGSKVARAIVGQPRSTIDFRELIARDAIVIINLHAFDVIEDIAALIGGTLLNLAARAVSSQSSLRPEQRRSVTIAVDEFHTIPGADYEQVFGELSKYGANMMLATQTLARLDRLTEGDRTRDLRAAVFSNLDGLFAFHTSAEDADYLAEELGGGLDKQDVLELGHYQCYARLTDARTGERLPAFSVRLDAPPAGDLAVAAQLARESAQRYGREALDVELDLQAAAERVYGRRGQTSTDEPYPARADPDPNAAGAVSASRASLGAHVPQRVRAHGEAKRRRERSQSEPVSSAAGGAPQEQRQAPNA